MSTETPRSRRAQKHMGPFPLWMIEAVQRADVTYRELATWVGVSPTTIQRIKSGWALPSQRDAERIALGVGEPMEGLRAYEADRAERDRLQIPYDGKTGVDRQTYQMRGEETRVRILHALATNLLEQTMPPIAGLLTERLDVGSSATVVAHLRVLAARGLVAMGPERMRNIPITITEAGVDMAVRTGWRAARCVVQPGLARALHFRTEEMRVALEDWAEKARDQERALGVEPMPAPEDASTPVPSAPPLPPLPPELQQAWDPPPPDPPPPPAPFEPKSYDEEGEDIFAHFHVDELGALADPSGSS